MKTSAQLQAITSLESAGSGTLICPSEIFGGCTIYADGTNPVTVTVTRTDNGRVVFAAKTLTGGAFHAPYGAGTKALSWSISGTNGAACFYGWGKTG